MSVIITAPDEDFCKFKMYWALDTFISSVIVFLNYLVVFFLCRHRPLGYLSRFVHESVADFISIKGFSILIVSELGLLKVMSRIIFLVSLGAIFD